MCLCLLLLFRRKERFSEETASSLYEKAKKLMFSDCLWHLKTLDEMLKELDPHKATFMV